MNSCCGNHCFLEFVTFPCSTAAHNVPFATMENLFVERPLRIANWVYAAEHSSLTEFVGGGSGEPVNNVKTIIAKHIQDAINMVPHDLLLSSALRFVNGVQINDHIKFHVHDAFVVGKNPLILAGQTSMLPHLEDEKEVWRLGRKGWLTTFPMAPDENPVHALKAPVNRILGIAAILQTTGSNDPEKRELYGFLEQSSERLKRLVQWLLNEEPSPAPTTNAEAARYIARFLVHSNIEAHSMFGSGFYGSALNALLTASEKQGFDITLTGGWSKHGHAYLDLLASDQTTDTAIADRISSIGWVFPREVVDYLIANTNVSLLVIQNGATTMYRLPYAHPTVQVENQSPSHLVQ